MIFTGNSNLKVNIGDEFLLSVDSIYKDSKDNVLYKMAGFNSLVFDANGIEKLRPYNHEAKEQKAYRDGYVKGADEQLKVAKAFISDMMNLSKDKAYLVSTYGSNDLWGIAAKEDIFRVIKKYKEFKNLGKIKKQHTFEVGDVVKCPGCDRGIITLMSFPEEAGVPWAHVVGKNFQGDIAMHEIIYLDEHKELFD